jgi:DNA-binding XRE family transcriptional regulator
LQDGFSLCRYQGIGFSRAVACFFYVLGLSAPADRLSNLGKRIRALRKKNWVQADLSTHTNMDREHISEIENGKKVINIITLQVLARALDTTMSALLKGL